MASVVVVVLVVVVVGVVVVVVVVVVGVVVEVVVVVAGVVVVRSTLVHVAFSVPRQPVHPTTDVVLYATHSSSLVQFAHGVIRYGSQSYTPLQFRMSVPVMLM